MSTWTKIFEDCVKDLTSCCEQRINMVLKAKGTRKAYLRECSVYTVFHIFAIGKGD